MATPSFIYFNSNAQAPRHLLSNFSAATIVFTAADVCPAMRGVCPSLDRWMQGRVATFPSSEHLWQSLKAKSLDAFLAFTSGGCCAGCDVLLAIYGEKGLRKWQWWMRKGCVGIAAKLASNPKHKIRLTLVGMMDYSREHLGADAERAVWLTILRLKFRQCVEHRQVLLGTGDAPLIEYDNKAALHGKHWGGLWCKDTQQVVGENAMGKYMTAIRAEFAERAAPVPALKSQ